MNMTSRAKSASVTGKRTVPSWETADMFWVIIVHSCGFSEGSSAEERGKLATGGGLEVTASGDC